jgi:hypothetical protein
MGKGALPKNRALSLMVKRVFISYSFFSCFVKRFRRFFYEFYEKFKKNHPPAPPALTGGLARLRKMATPFHSQEPAAPRTLPQPRPLPQKRTSQEGQNVIEKQQCALFSL